MEFVVERQVAAPAARVWAVITDLDRSPDVLSGVSRIERLDDGGGFGVGTRWRETRTMFGKEAVEEMQVTSIDPERSYTVEATQGSTHYRSVLSVEPRGDGTSHLAMRFGAEARGVGTKLLAATLGRAFAGATRKALARDLDDIARAAEVDEARG